MPPLVSLLIPCYNAAPYLATALNSVYDQTWRRIEVIVVDDGSTDGSASIARRYESRGLRLFKQANRGQCAAFNTAIRHATGDYWSFFDADDILAPTKIALQIDRLIEAGPGFVASGEWARFTRTHTAAIFNPERVWKDLAPIDWLVESWMGGGMMHGAAWLVPRDVAQRAGPWDESLSLINDLDFFTRILLASRGVVFCKGSRTYYRSGDGATMSSKRTPAACASGFKALRLSRESLLRAEDSPRTRLACATALQRFIYWVYPDGQEFIADAEREVRRLGGAPLKPEGGTWFTLATSLVGWKTARHLQRQILLRRRNPSILKA